MIKIDPSFCCSQEISQRSIRPAFGYRELKLADKALGVAIIGWGASSAHRTHEAFRQQCRSRLESSILAALIRMKDGARYRELHELDGGHHQIRTHVIIKGQRQAMACPFPERKTAPHGSAIRQMN